MRTFSVEEYSDQLGFQIVNTFEGFNRNFDEPHTIDQIALVKDEDELVVFAVDNVTALTWLTAYLREYKPNALLVGYFMRPTLKITNPLTNYQIKP